MIHCGQNILQQQIIQACSCVDSTLFLYQEHFLEERYLLIVCGNCKVRTGIKECVHSDTFSTVINYLCKWMTSLLFLCAFCFNLYCGGLIVLCVCVFSFLVICILYSH